MKYMSKSIEELHELLISGKVTSCELVKEALELSHKVQEECNAFVTILSTVKGTDVVKMYKNDTQYYATFLDTEGKFLADGTTVFSTSTECSTSAKYQAINAWLN